MNGIFRSLLTVFITLYFALWSSSDARAQSEQDTRRIEEKARAALKPTELAILSAEERFVVSYGYWINYLFTDFKDDDNDSTAPDATDTTHALDHRFWIRASLRPPTDGSSQNEYSVYLRVKDKHTWRDPQNTNGTYDGDGPHVDYLFASLDFRPFFVQVGRRFFQAGQGISYSDIGDGIEVMYSADVWSLMGFVSQSLPHKDNLDLSVPGGKKSGRTFYGIEGSYIGIIGHGLKGYVVIERDDGEERPENATQDFDYDAEYFGIGSEGTLFHNVRYAAEFIYETGTSFTSGTNQEKDIDAWALDVSITYDAPWALQPTIYAEYAVGSGDSDRVNVTDTIGGNLTGNDSNFLYFGYLPMGYALSPRLSNIQMLKGGLVFKPLEAMQLFKDLTVSMDYFQFYKHEPAGGVFDGQASLSDRDVGYEIDFTLSWPVLSDLTLDIEYGHFQPGDAYPSTTSEASQYFSVGVTSQF